MAGVVLKYWYKILVF